MRFSRRLLLNLLYLLLVFLIIAAVFVAFKPKKKEVTYPKPPSSGQSAKDKSKDGLSVSQGQDGSRLGSPANPNDVSKGTSSTSTTTPSNSPSSSTGVAGKTAPDSLASTGPNETIAVFAGFSIAGTMIYRRYLAKKIV